MSRYKLITLYILIFCVNIVFTGCKEEKNDLVISDNGYGETSLDFDIKESQMNRLINTYRREDIVRSTKDLESEDDKNKSLEEKPVEISSKGKYIHPLNDLNRYMTSDYYGCKSNGGTDRDKRCRELEKGKLESHRGVDYRAPVGSIVYATESGEVTETSDETKNSYGIFIRINHGTFSSIYAHLDKKHVKKGDKIKKGEKIGLSGNTGRSTAPHLHFEINIDRSYVDPLPWINNMTEIK